MTETENSHTGTAYEPEVTYPSSSDAVTLAVSGDPVVGRALELLLRGFNYDVRLLPVSSLNEPGMLKGVRLMLLTLTHGLSSGRREALLRSIGDAPDAARVPILELVASSEERRDDEARPGRQHIVPWPCSTKELRRRIEAALLYESELDRADYQGRPT